MVRQPWDLLHAPSLPKLSPYHGQHKKLFALISDYKGFQGNETSKSLSLREEKRWALRLFLATFARFPKVLTGGSGNSDKRVISLSNSEECWASNVGSLSNLWVTYFRSPFSTHTKSSEWLVGMAFPCLLSLNKRLEIDSSPASFAWYRRIRSSSFNR